jgi:hypothetical protein
MEDPLPANIEGEKRVVHSVEHRVNWGYVAAAVVALVVLLKVAPALADRNDSAGSEESEEW